jgi:hypothetical protein
MSAWDPYVQQLMQNGNMEHAAVLGHDANPWAKSAGFNLGNYNFEVSLDVDKKGNETVNEAAIVQESKSPAHPSLQDQGTSRWQGRH